ncbi:MAG: DNA polymerase III subunit delta [Atopobiaceae bacterium]|nr:DNA polymerase III subunit delta [Atopobiaceae bacterium]
MAQELLPAYLVVGTDELKAKEVVARLRKRLEPGFEAFNLDERTVTSDLEAQDLLASLNTLPFGSGFRLVIVMGADHMAKPVSEAIVAYLSDPNPASVLCLVAEKLAKTTRLYKAVAKLGSKAIIDCSPAKRWDLPKKMARMAQKHGMRIDESASTELIARVGESTTMLDQQIATLSELCRNAGVITRADVERYVTRTAEVKPWDFLDAMSERNAGRALELYQLMQNPSEIALVSMLVGRIRELVCAQSLAARGQSGSLASTLGKQAWQVKSHTRWASRFAAGELSRSLAACATCDQALKSGADPRTTFIKLILAVCGSVAA